MSAMRELTNANRSVSTLMGLTCVLVEQATGSLQMDTAVQVSNTNLFSRPIQVDHFVILHDYNRH